MLTTDTAPRWAVPFLAAHFVATSRRHRLRPLDNAAFHRTARACDQFILGTTVPGFVASALMLPGAFGLCLLLACSCWGIVLVLAIGRRVAIERRRRGSPHRPASPG